MPDARVLLSDYVEKYVLVADLKGGAVDTVGRLGKGPGEYTRAFTLYSLGGDSSLMRDGMDRRWLTFVGDRIVRVTTPEDRAVAAVGSDLPIGTDGVGHLYMMRTALPRSQRASTPDSMILMRVVRATGRVDTVARLNPGAESQRGSPPFLSTRADRAAVCLDGWIAIVRASPYRVDWRSPNGQWTIGRQIPIQEVSLTTREKEAYMQRRAGRDKAQSPDTFRVWPSTIPPLHPAAPPMAAPDGRVVVRLSPTADHPEPRYDVVNRSGNRERQIRLNMDQSIIGFGDRSVFVATTDPDGVMRVSRHPWP